MKGTIPAYEGEFIAREALEAVWIFTENLAISKRIECVYNSNLLLFIPLYEFSVAHLRPNSLTHPHDVLCTQIVGRSE